MLTSEDCSTPVGRWASGARLFWRMLGRLSDGRLSRLPEEVRTIFSIRGQSETSNGDVPVVD